MFALLAKFKEFEFSCQKCEFIAVCGGELNMESGQLESPNYPEDYVPNKECIWVITVPVGFQVALKFQSFEVSQFRKHLETVNNFGVLD